MAKLPDDRPERPITFAALGAYGLLAAFIEAVVILELTPAPAALLHAAAAPLAGWALWRVAARWMGAAAGVLTRGVGLAAGIGFLVTAMQDPWNGAAPAAGLLVLGVGFLEATVPRGGRRTRWVLAAAAVVTLLPGLVLLLAFEPFRGGGAWRLQALAAGTVATLVVTRVLHAATGDDGRLAAFTQSPARNAAAVAALLGYLLYRPLVEARVNHVEVFEWGVALALVGLVVHGVRRRLADAAVPVAWESVAKRHAQEAAPRFEPALQELTEATEAYLHRGQDPDRYERLWQDAYVRAGLDAHRVTVALRDAADDGGRRRIPPDGRRNVHDTILAPFRENHAP